MNKHGNSDRTRARRFLNALYYVLGVGTVLILLFSIACEDDLIPNMAGPSAVTTPAAGTSPAGETATAEPAEPGETATPDPESSPGEVTATRPRSRGDRASSTFVNGTDHTERIGLCSYGADGPIETALQHLKEQTYIELHAGRTKKLDVWIDCAWQVDAVIGAGECPQTSRFKDDWARFGLELLEANVGERECEPPTPECPEMELTLEETLEGGECGPFVWEIRGSVSNAERVTVNGAELGNPFGFEATAGCGEEVSARIEAYHHGEKCFDKTVQASRKCDPCCEDDPHVVSWEGCRVKDIGSPVLEGWGSATVSGNASWELCLVAYATAADVAAGERISCGPVEDCDQATPECLEEKVLEVHAKITEPKCIEYGDFRLVLYKDGTEIDRQELGPCN